ncbi:hypothetical protein AgCh_026475 [Apium graveolens]
MGSGAGVLTFRCNRSIWFCKICWYGSVCECICRTGHEVVLGASGNLGKGCGFRVALRLEEVGSRVGGVLQIDVIILHQGRFLVWVFFGEMVTFVMSVLSCSSGGVCDFPQARLLLGFRFLSGNLFGQDFSEILICDKGNISGWVCLLVVLLWFLLGCRVLQAWRSRKNFLEVIVFMQAKVRADWFLQDWLLS